MCICVFLLFSYESAVGSESFCKAYRLGSLWVAPSQAGDVGHLEVFVSLESEPKLVHSWFENMWS